MKKDEQLPERGVAFAVLLAQLQISDARDCLTSVVRLSHASRCRMFQIGSDLFRCNETKILCPGGRTQTTLCYFDVLLNSSRLDFSNGCSLPLLLKLDSPPSFACPAVASLISGKVEFQDVPPDI